MLLAPRLAHFVGPPTPYRGQHQRPGKAGSAVFREVTQRDAQGTKVRKGYREDLKGTSAGSRRCVHFVPFASIAGIA